MTPVLALSSGTIAAIVVIVIIDLFAIMFGLSFARSRRAERQARAAETAAILGEAPPQAPKPVSRREFFRRSLVVSLLVFGAEFGGATLAFLWPALKGGFGSVINAGQARRHHRVHQRERPAVLLGHRPLLHRAVQRQARRRHRLRGRGVEADGVMPPVPALRAPRMPRPVLPAVPVVRVPVPRIEVQHRRRVQARARPTRAWTASWSRSPRAVTCWSTRRCRSSGHREGPTRSRTRPRARSAWRVT